MPNNPQQPKRSWRDDKAGNGRGVTRPWQQEPGARRAWLPRFTKRAKIFTASAALLVLIGGIVVLLWLRHRIDPPRLVLIGDRSETNLPVPPNVHGKNGLDALASWAGLYRAKQGGNHELVIDVLKKDLDGGDPFVEALKGCTSKSVIIFLSTHGGGSDGQGAYLIRGDGSVKDGKAVYPMSKAFTALEQLPRDTRKLLLLDTTQVSTDWELGLLHNDFVRSLQTEPRLKTIPNLVVLCASDQDQKSWVSEEFGRSIFAHYVLEGMNGAADESGNGRVTALELANYVKKKVEFWVRHNRGALQTPLLLGDEKAAGEMELLAVVDTGYHSPDPKAIPAFTEPPGLRAAWKERDELLEQTAPPPYAYAPHLWTRYQQTLLRAEELFRAGDAADADEMLKTAHSLAGNIRRTPRVEREALANSLAMPAAFGWPAPAHDAASQNRQKEFAALWDGKAKPDKFRARLAEWKGGADDPMEKHWLRVRMAALLLERARQSDEQFQRACAILPEIDDVQGPRRPAEAHLALMLNNYVPAEGRGERVRKALELRRRAEQAALGLKDGDAATPYSEQVLPWIRADVEQADARRRAAEDLLFASPREAARSDELRGEADALYAKAQERAALVRSALQTRDRALAVLPSYSQWLARQPLPEDEVRGHLELWDNVHLLCRLLEAPDPAQAEALREPLKKIQLNHLESSFKARCDGNFSETQQSWHEIQALLSVPLIPADRRIELLLQSRRISHALNEGTANAGEVPGVSKQQNALMAEAAAQRQGRYALALIGRDTKTYKEAEPIVTRPEGEWQRSLNRAGELIGEQFRQQAASVYKETDEGRKTPLKDAAPLLRSAALHARLLSGADAAAWPDLDPVGENRRLQLCELCGWQARRAYLDYWASEDERRQPYFRAAAGVYLAAARALAGGDSADLTDDQKKARLADLDGLENTLKLPDKLELRYRDGDTYRPGPAVLHVTDEDTVTRGFALEAPASAPPGFPVIWEELGKRLKPEKPDDVQRRVLELKSAKAAELPVEYVLKPESVVAPSFEKGRSRHDLRGFYRGRRFEVKTAVTLHDLPEIVSSQAERPKTARLAILASEDDYNRFAAAYSELVIVVDYSGSMTTKKPGENQRRIDKALAALETCLHKVPKGVKVTLLTFSQESDGGNIVPQWKQVAWDPSPKAVRERVRQLGELKPKYNTPLVRATVEAKRYFSDGFRGARTVVVLTDGGDNTFYGDPELRKLGPTMEKCLRKVYDDSGILVNVIGFELSQLTDADEKKGHQEYVPAIKAIFGSESYVDVEKSAELAGKLERFLLQIRYFMETEAGKALPDEVISEDGREVSRDRSGYHWVHGLKPEKDGTYKVFLNSNRLTKRAVEQRIRLEGGDSLVLQLTPKAPGSNEFQFRREIYVDSHPIRNLNTELKRQELKEAGWLFTVQQNQLITNRFQVNAAQLMTTIEKKDDRPSGKDVTVQVTRPRFVWYRVTTEADPAKIVPGLHFYPLADYEAPAYSLDLAKWPVGARTRLESWWNEDAIPDCEVLRERPGKRVIDQVPLSLEVRPTDQDERTRIVVESIGYEARPVRLRPDDEKETPKVDCLVVRLRYPDGTKPFFVSLPDRVADGWEHRFYTEAGSYTGIFWNVNEEQVKNLQYLKIHSVEGAKNHRNVRHVEPITLGVPNPNGTRPPKPRD